MAVLPARFLKFAAVGLSGVALDMLILWLLKGRLGWPLTLSQAGCGETAMANNFLWNDLWDGRRSGPRRARLRNGPAAPLRASSTPSARRGSP